HMTVFPRILSLLKDQNAVDIRVIGGGVIPDADAIKLKQMGVAALFLQDATPGQIVGAVRGLVSDK
ncbi:MAG TPA: hypothetical protein PL074_09775, partial [Thermoflexales bacterium]|nr:hypothetical protein [Thermoflexales bacterium]